MSPGTPAGNRFDVPATLIEAHEAKEPPVLVANRIDVLRFAIGTLGRTQTQSADLFGSRSRASEILNRQRPLPLDLIRITSAAWHLPIGALAADDAFKKASA